MTVLDRLKTLKTCPTQRLKHYNRRLTRSTSNLQRWLIMRNLLLLFSLLVFSGVTASRVAAERPNVLFIAVDDLRPELACYGEQHIHSPHIDRLAKSGTLFERAYCMVPTCGASRASLMTGIRPNAKRFVNYLAWAEKDAPGITTLNSHFKNNGYRTTSLGKIFHHPADNSQGWSQPAWRPRGVARYQLPGNARRHEEGQKLPRPKRGPAWESADVPDNSYADGVLAERAVAELGRLKNNEEPFFLAVGFFKPHLPFVAPQKYWDLYDHADIQLPANYHVPQAAPKESIHSSGELRAYADIPAKGPVSEATARNLIHGYYACVSYTDALIGSLLDELDRLQMTDNTIVVLWGDHGWNLGEHTLWCKHSCYETSMRIPLIVRMPGVTDGRRTPALTESIDVYPTLCELAGIPLPEHLQGRSLVAVLKNPDIEWDATATGRYRNGDTIRSADYRFTKYTNGQGRVTARMLYDHSTDPDENVNRISDQELGDSIKRLAGQLRRKMSQP